MIYYLINVIVTIIVFIIGVNIGMSVKKEKKIEIPNIPKKITEIKEGMEKNKEMKKLNIILENIDNYDGTGQNQKDVI